MKRVTKVKAGIVGAAVVWGFGSYGAVSHVATSHTDGQTFAHITAAGGSTPRAHSSDTHSTGGGHSDSGGSTGTTSQCNVTYSTGDDGPNEQEANAMAASVYGWRGCETVCLDELWTRESAATWSPTVTNPNSGAYGIPQSLPAGKMASAGSDWQTDPVTQIKWGLGYIDATYGTPCGAWGHEMADNWYL